MPFGSQLQTAFFLNRQLILETFLKLLVIMGLPYFFGPIKGSKYNLMQNKLVNSERGKMASVDVFIFTLAKLCCNLQIYQNTSLFVLACLFLESHYHELSKNHKMSIKLTI
jgi:hypothetical protein